MEQVYFPVLFGEVLGADIQAPQVDAPVRLSELAIHAVGMQQISEVSPESGAELYQAETTLAWAPNVRVQTELAQKASGLYAVRSVALVLQNDVVPGRDIRARLRGRPYEVSVSYWDADPHRPKIWIEHDGRGSETTLDGSLTRTKEREWVSELTGKFFHTAHSANDSR